MKILFIQNLPTNMTLKYFVMKNLQENSVSTLNFQLKKNFCSSTSIFLTVILYITFKNENIIPTNMCYNQMDVFIQNLQENSVSTLSEMSKNFECS